MDKGRKRNFEFSSPRSGDSSCSSSIYNVPKKNQRLFVNEELSHSDFNVDKKLVFGFIGDSDTSFEITRSIIMEKTAAKYYAWNKTTENRSQLEHLGAYFTYRAKDVFDVANVVFFFSSDDDDVEGFIFQNYSGQSFIRLSFIVIMEPMSINMAKMLFKRVINLSGRYLEIISTVEEDDNIVQKYSSLAAGDQLLFNLLKPTLKSFVKVAHYLGDEPGMAITQHCVAISLMVQQMINVAQCCAVTQKSGIDAETQRELIKSNGSQHMIDIVACITSDYENIKEFSVEYYYKQILICLNVLPQSLRPWLTNMLDYLDKALQGGRFLKFLPRALFRIFCKE